MGGWYNKEIRTLDDVKGLKIRIPGFGGEIWKRLAEPVAMPGGEIAAALKNKENRRRREWVGLLRRLQMEALPAVARFYYYPGVVGAVRRVESVREQSGLRRAASRLGRKNIASGWVNQWMMAAYDTCNPAAYKRMIGNWHPCAIVPNNFMIASVPSAFAIYDAEAAANPAFKRSMTPGSATVPRSMRMAQDSRGSDDQFPLATGGRKADNRVLFRRSARATRSRATVGVIPGRSLRYRTDPRRANRKRDVARTSGERGPSHWQEPPPKGKAGHFCG